MVPGEYLLKGEPTGVNAGRERRRLEVNTRGDRPIQVGSHCHFFEVNRALRFDRAAAYGLRLDIPAGTSVRVEPGEEPPGHLVPLGGRRIVHGLNGLVEGELDAPAGSARAHERMVRHAG